MKSAITYGMIIFFTGILSAQSNLSTFLENWITTQQNLDTEIQIEELIIKYNNIEFNVDDINKKNKWKAFFFLSVHELKSIFDFIDNNEDVTNVIFLNRIKELTPEKAYYIRLKLLESESLRNFDRKDRNKILSYLYSPDINTLKLFKNRNRLNFNTTNVSWVLQTEKDIGEDNTLDYISSGIAITKPNYKLFMGDYLTQFGLGLSLFQGFQFSNIRLVNQQKVGFRLNSGANENYFMRGLAIEKEIKSKMLFFGFINKNKSDGRINANRITNVFIDGTHDTDTDIKNRNIIDISSYGFAFKTHFKKTTNTILFHAHHFPIPIQSFNQNYLNQNSLAHSFSFIGSKFVFQSETAFDQFKYWSNISIGQLSLSKNFYFKSYFVYENPNFKTYYRQIPDVYSNPEEYYGYQLEYFSKTKTVDFNYTRSRDHTNVFNEKSQNQFRFSSKFRLVNRNSLQFNYFHREKQIQTEDEVSHLNRVQAKLNLSLRGKWNWQQTLQVKFGEENGIGFQSKFEYKTDPLNVKFGAMLFYQNRGALYFYENDVPGFGYIRGFFDSGFLWYGLIGYSKRKSKLYFKTRVLQLNNKNIIGCSMGISHTF